jgi:hypothetical protein
LRKILLLLLALSLTATLLTVSVQQTDAAQMSHMLRSIDGYREQTWHWQRVTMRPRTPTKYSERSDPSPRYRHWVLRLWRKRAHKARRHATRPPHLAAWRCIHRYEGRWDDPNPPYYGGLQMDMSFQRKYGAYLLRKRGTADHWTPHEQMWVAERALRAGRGFYPWPNTARACGLL